MKNDISEMIFTALFGRKEEKSAADIKLLAESVVLLAGEVSKISQHFLTLAGAIKDQREAIEQIVAVQEYILSSMGEDLVEFDRYKMPKIKAEKPN